MRTTSVQGTGSAPRNLAAEAAVLGALLYDGRRFVDVTDRLSPADFYDGRHEAVYRAMAGLSERGQPIELIAVAAELQAQGTAGRFGPDGPEAILTGLLNEAGTAAHLVQHAELVRDAALRRALADAGEHLSAAARAPDRPAPSALEDGQRALFALASRTTPRASQTVRQILPTVIERIEKRFTEKRAVSGVPTGFDEVDEMTAGLQLGELTIVAARPSMGKTTFATQAALHAAEAHGIPVLVFSLEMQKEQLVERLLAAESRIDSQRLRTGFLQSRDFVSLHKTTKRLAEAPLKIDDAGQPTLLQIASEVRRWRHETRHLPRRDDLALVVVDYLQLVATPAVRGKQSTREREIADIAAGLKALAKETRVALVALSQLNRGLEGRADKRPLLSDLRESGAIEQDADLICFLYRDEYYDKQTADPGIAELIVGKARNGPTGTCKLRWEGSCTRFDNLSHREAA